MLVSPRYPRRDGQPLRGLPRFRFLVLLWFAGHRSVASFQESTRSGRFRGVRVDGKVGPQTWDAFWKRR